MAEQAHTPFRPSNGTHGDIFMSEWCENCKRHHDEDEHDYDEYCTILTDMMAFNVESDSYPKQVIQDDTCLSGGRCTAFEDKHNGEKAYRCVKTPDMFTNTPADGEYHG